MTNSTGHIGFAAKYGSAGNVLWAIPLESEEYTDTAADTAGNVYLLDRSVSLTQITPNGQVAWKKQVVPPYGAAPASLAPSPDGGVLFVGSSEEEGIVAKFSSAGEELWRKSSQSSQTAWTSFYSRGMTGQHGKIHFAGIMSPTSESSSCAFDRIVFNPVPSSLIVLTLAHSPILNQSASGNLLTLSWATNEPGFLLETADTIEQGGSWQVVTNAVTISNSQNTVTKPVSGNSAFYRLRKTLP